MSAPSPTKVDLIYTVAPVGPVSLAALVAAMGAATLPTSDLLNIGVSLINDTTSAVGGNAQRDLQFSLLPPFVPLTAASAPGTFQGSLISSSANDSRGGSGCTAFRINYTDQDGQPQYEIVVPTGTTPVNLTSKTKVTITGIVPLTGTPDGIIYVYSGLMGTGLFIASLVNNFQGSILSSSSADSASGVGARQVRITYMDKNGGGPFTEDVTLNGTTPVNLTNVNHATIINMQLLDVGATGSSCGIISIMSGLNGTGALSGFLGQSFFQFFPQKTVVAPAIVPPSEFGQTQVVPLGGSPTQYAQLGTGVQGTPTNVAPGSPSNAGSVVAADIGAPFRGIYTQILGAALVSQVTASEPAFS
jgi:hypothetical protein